MSRSPSPVTADLADLRTEVRRALAVVALLGAVAAVMAPFATEYDPESVYARVATGTWDTLAILQAGENQPLAKLVILAFPIAMVAICFVAWLAWIGMAPRHVVMAWIGSVTLVLSVAAACVPAWWKPHLVAGTWETGAGPYLGVATSLWVLLAMRRLGEF
jgi:hypothetical protein